MVVDIAEEGEDEQEVEDKQIEQGVKEPDVEYIYNIAGEVVDVI